MSRRTVAYVRHCIEARDNVDSYLMPNVRPLCIPANHSRALSLVLLVSCSLTLTACSPAAVRPQDWLVTKPNAAVGS